jgi:hypothetical protein
MAKDVKVVKNIKMSVTSFRDICANGYLLRSEFIYSHATLIGTPCVLPLEGPNFWKVPLTEKALFYVINVPAKTSVRPKPGPVIWKVPISKVPITVAQL